MLSIDEARAVVLEALPAARPAQDVALTDALGRFLAAPVVAAGAVPPFDNSAMDGFAVHAGRGGERLELVGESRAGAPFSGTLSGGQTVRISTGAALPAGATGVLQLELVTVTDGAITLGADVEAGRNVRGAGEDVQEGATVLETGTLLGAAELAVVANVGQASVRVAACPRVAIVGTGDELVDPGSPLGPGQIHESNSTALRALVTQTGGRTVHVGRAGDDPAATREAIASALDGTDVLLLTGGVSVGPHDHVKPALRDLGVQERFWRVALRPGRPTWCGSREGVLVLGLPGNPVSAMVTFLLFARPALLALQGADPDPRRSRAVLASSIARHPDRDECVRVVRTHAGTVAPTGPQGSHVLTSMLGAVGLAVVPRGEGELPAGSEIELLEL